MCIRDSDYKYAVMRTGKRAITHYEVVEAFGPASLVEVCLLYTSRCV